MMHAMGRIIRVCIYVGKKFWKLNMRVLRVFFPVTCLSVFFFYLFSKPEVMYYGKYGKWRPVAPKGLTFTKVIVKSSRKTISVSFPCVSVLVASGMMRSVLIYILPFFSQSIFSSIIGHYRYTQLGRTLFLRTFRGN